MRCSIQRRDRRARSSGARLVGTILLTGTLLQGGPLGAQGRDADPAAVDPGGAPETVACALPAKVDRLGTRVTRLGPRAVIETAPDDCAARGGEVVDEDPGAQPEAAGRAD